MKRAKRPATPRRRSADTLTAADMKMMNESVDRAMERWARKLLLVDGRTVRHLTEEEIKVAAGPRRARTTKKRR